eukprot:6979296-Pyramimonas_sp.AAC.1
MVQIRFTYLSGFAVHDLQPLLSINPCRIRTTRSLRTSRRSIAQQQRAMAWGGRSGPSNYVPCPHCSRTFAPDVVRSGAPPHEG